MDNNNIESIRKFGGDKGKKKSKSKRTNKIEQYNSIYGSATFSNLDMYDLEIELGFSKVLSTDNLHDATSRLAIP